MKANTPVEGGKGKELSHSKTSATTHGTKATNGTKDAAAASGKAASALNNGDQLANNQHRKENE